MKKIITTLITILLTVSCSNDDDSNSEQVQFNTENAEELIMGDWKLVSSSEDGETLNLSECQLQQTISFNDDGIYSEILYNGNEPCGSGYENIGSYTIDNVIISYSLGGVNFIQEVININESNLILKEIYTESNGITYTYLDTYTRN